MITNPNDPINEVESLQALSLTKREYFAAMAMQGWIACQHDGFSGDELSQAERAVKCADALITELNK